MIAWLLRLELAADLLVLVFVFLWTGLSGLSAIAAAFVALLGLYLLLTVLTFLMTGFAASSRLRRLGMLRLARLIVSEWLAFFALFAFIQPFPNLFMRTSRAGSADSKLSILLVHGYSCNAALWASMAGHLLKDGYCLRAVNLEPPFDGLGSLAKKLHENIELEVEKGTEVIILITHSMGGLVARACLQRYGCGPVVKLITIACPHDGTEIARLGFGQNARDMVPGSEWLKSLSAQLPDGPALFNIWSRDDNFISPQASAHLHSARNIEVEGIGHLSMVFSKKVLGLVNSAIASGTEAKRESQGRDD
jgi:triacylglycerol esterase/lipase EstA (alpha/beta hydrolase family)